MSGTLALMAQDTTSGTAYRWSTLGAADVEAWSDLVNHLATVDGTEEFLSAEDLAEELQAPGHDPEQDTWAAWDGNTMVGYASVSAPRTPDRDGQSRGYIGGGVRLEHRGRGLGSALLDRAEPRAEHLALERHPDLTGYLSADGGLEGSSARVLLADRGYAVARYYNYLTRGLDDLPAVGEVAGVELVDPTDADLEDTRLAHNAAFADHWGSGPVDAERWRDMWTSRSSRPAVSTLARGRGGPLDGQVLAYVLLGQWVDREAYVSILGTIPSARGRGIAAVALARSMRLVAESGDYDLIGLDVDSESLTGATRLYERLGFGLKLQTAAMRRPLPPV